MYQFTRWDLANFSVQHQNLCGILIVLYLLGIHIIAYTAQIIPTWICKSVAQDFLWFPSRLRMETALVGRMRIVPTEWG